MKFQYAQPSQVQLPETVFAILKDNVILAVAFDGQSANEIAAYNSAYTIAQGVLID